jgi:hypothetical protein
MSRITSSDFEKLARGQALPREEFLALLNSAEAAPVLEQAALLAELLGPVREESEAVLSSMPVTWEEIGLYTQGRLADEARRTAVQRFLSEHGPEALRPPSALSETRREDISLDQTGYDLPPAGPRPPRPQSDS